MNRTIFKMASFFIVLLFTLIAGCTVGGPAVHGRVVDAKSGEPIAGAYVLVRWAARISSLVDSTSGNCIYQDSVMTDRNGEFHTPRWRRAQTEDERGVITGIATSTVSPIILIYKPTYLLRRYDGRRKNREYQIERDLSTPMERIASLSMAMGCVPDSSDPTLSSERAMPMIGAMLDEARTLAVRDPSLVKAYRQTWSVMKVYFCCGQEAPPFDPKGDLTEPKR